MSETKTKQITKEFELGGRKVVVKKVADLKVKVGKIREMAFDTVEGTWTMFKLVTGTDDKFINELYPDEVAEVVKWASE